MTTSESLAIGIGRGPALASPSTHPHVGDVHHPASYTTSFGSATSHIMRSLLGTSVRNVWIPSRAIETMLRMFPAPVGTDREYVLVIPAERVLLDDVAERAFHRPQPRLEEPLPVSAVVARALRDFSGLSAERLGEVFPVARETFQRWVTGTGHPSTANLQRLMLLDRFVRDISSRTDDVKAWLLAPVEGRADMRTPYDLIKEGRLTEAWNLARSAGSARFERYRDAEGNFATRVRGNIAGTLESEGDGHDDFDD